MDVEKARRTTKLLQIGFSEGLFEDYVDKILANIVILVLESSCQVNLAPSIFIDLNLGLFTSIGRLKDKGLVQFCQRVYRLSTDNICTEGLLQRSLLRANDIVDTSRLPHLVWLDVKDVLVHAGVLSKRQPVLVRAKIHFSCLSWIPNYSFRSDHGFGPRAYVAARPLYILLLHDCCRLASLRLLTEAWRLHFGKRIVLVLSSS